MTYTPKEDATVRFLLQDRDHEGEERCPECGSAQIRVERQRGEIAWALCDDCGFSLVMDEYIPPRDLAELPEEIRAHYTGP